MLRMMLPQLIGVVIFLSILWVVAIKFNQAMKEAINVAATKVAQWITLITVIIFAIWAIDIASTNEIPRSVIDRSGQEKMIKSLDESTKEKASEPKQTETNSNNIKNN